MALAPNQYGYELGNGVIKMINKSTNIGIKKGLRSKKATTKCSIKKTDKQVTTTLQATCLYLKRFRKDKDVVLQVYSLDCLVCKLKRKTEQAIEFHKEFNQSCVNTRCM